MKRTGVHVIIGEHRDSWSGAIRTVATLAGLLTCLIFPEPARGQAVVEWHSENIQLLRGFDYELGDAQRTILTVEHASRWRYGDVFVFTDFAFGDDGQNTVYGEITPRFSLSRLSGTDLSWGPVEDVFLAFNYERGEQGLQRYLGGVATDLDLPGFRFARLHAFHRDDPRRDGTTWQITFAWNRPLEFAGQAFLSEGFADLAGGEGTGVENQLFVPRLLWDFGAHHGRPGRYYIGVERQMWWNKFGVEGVDESVTQLQFKWVLH